MSYTLLTMSALNFSSSGVPRMVGREAQLTTLQTHLAAAVAGRGRAVFVAGDAGIGKTRLIRELLARNTGRVEVLEGRCYAEDPAVPYGPVVDALRTELRKIGHDAFVERAGPWLRDLGTLLPELQPAEHGGGLAVDAQFGKRRLFEALRHMLQPRDDGAPRVVLLEDLHWADQTTQELIRYLTRDLDDRRMLLLGSYRSDELHRRHRLTQLLSQLGRERLLTEVRLAPLDRDELGELLEAMLGVQPLSSLLDALYERSEGNPFYCEELLASLVDNGRLHELLSAPRHIRAVEQLELPTSLSDSILSRVAELAAPAADVLRWAAVCGRRFDFEVLLRVTGLPEAVLIDALQALLERQLVVEERTQTGDSYRFRHALTREAAYEDLLGRERRLMHRAVVDVLEQLYAADPDAVIDQLAYHSQQARDTSRAASYALLAGDRAVDMFAYRDALAYFETALDLLEGEAARERAELYERMGHTAYRLGDAAQVIRYWAEALRLAQLLGERTLVGDLHRRLGRAEWERGNKQLAFERLHDALAELEQAPPGYSLAMAYSGMSQLCMLTSDNHQSIVWAEKALALAEQLGAVDVSSHALNNIGCALVELGEAERGVAALERSLQLARDADAPMEAIRAYHNLGGRLLQGGRLQQAADVLLEGVNYAERAGWSLSHVNVSCLGQLANVELLLGNYASAHAVLDRAEAHGELPPRNVQYLALMRMQLLLRQGRLAEAHAVLDGMAEGLATHKEHKYNNLKLGMSVALALAAGRQHEAHALFERFLEQWEARGDPNECLGMLPWTLDLLLAVDRADDARRLIDRLARATQASVDPTDSVLVLTVSGILAADGGRLDDAAAMLGEASTTFERLCLPFESAFARRRRAQVLLLDGSAGARGEAQRELAAARATFERLGATLELEATDAVARRAGLLRRIARPHEQRDALTPRELQVLGVLARGLSNRAIAEQLVISEKTVEVHVSNILGKLGVQSRVQAATYAVDHGLIEPLAA